MNFINKKHQEKYEEIKQGMGFTNDRGEYASLAYILSSPLLGSKIDIVLGDDYRYRGYDEVQEIITNFPFLTSESERVMINLAISLYSSYGGDTIVNIFRALDKENFKVALNSINIRWGM